MNQYWVYIITNAYNTVLYIGVTNNLERRIFEHKNGIFKGFSKKYNLNKLVYYDESADINAAIAREKQLKGWSRIKKNVLIKGMNPQWNDLSMDWFQ